MAKKKKASGGDIPEWVVTYGDLMSLLLCFFILIAAFSEMKDPDEFREVIEKIKEALGFQGGMGIADISSIAANSNISAMTKQVNRQGESKNRDEAPQENLSGVAQRTTVVQEAEAQPIGGSLRFMAGSATLSLDIEEKLRREVAPKIRDRKNIVNIVGHAWGAEDAAVLGGHGYAAYLRAQAVEDYLVNECNVDKAILRIVIAGDREPSIEQRGKDAASNRRVQVFMTTKELDQLVTDPYGTGRGRD